MPLPELVVHDLGVLDIEDARAYEAFKTSDGAVFCGVQVGSWQGDFRENGGAWDSHAGRWVGPGPIRAMPRNLRINGQTLNTTGTYPVAEIAANTDFTALCGLIDYRPFGAGVGVLKFPATLEFRLYNAATGALVQTVEVIQNGAGEAEPTTIADFDGVASGSYQLCAHILAAARVPMTQAQYVDIIGVPLSPEYFYDETEGDNDSTFFWDYRRNVGRLPADTEHEFYGFRDLLVRSNGQLDKPEWASYLVGAGLEEGEWAFLRVRSGAGAWSAGDVFPNPGPALLQKSGELDEDSLWQVADAVPFDTMARCVSASKVVRWGDSLTTEKGDLLIAGNLSLESGTNSALWKLNGDGTSELLGYNTDLSNGFCQCAKRNHSINGIAELRDGTLFCLSECSLFIYDPTGATPGERLLGFPLGTDGEPGGYSLRVLNERVNFFTETFFELQFRDEPLFYNRYQELVEGRRDEAGPGTVWHGRECSAVLWGQLWGISQDSTFDDPEAQEWLSRLVGNQWVRDHVSSWPAHNYNWKQVASVRGRLILAGTQPVYDQELDEDTEEITEVEDTSVYLPIWAVDDGVRLREMDAPWIPQYLTRCDDADGREVLVCVARKTIEGALQPEQHVVTLSGLSVDEEEEVVEGCTDAQCELDSMPEGSRWKVIHPNLNGVDWTAIEVCDQGELGEDRLRPLERAMADAHLLWYRVDSTEDQDVLESYTHKAYFRRFLSLEHEALESIEMVVLWPDTLDDVVLPTIERRG